MHPQQNDWSQACVSLLLRRIHFLSKKCLVRHRLRHRNHSNHTFANHRSVVKRMNGAL
jgi:predicted transcriptional regulator